MFLRVLSAGTRSVAREEFQAFKCPLVFRGKEDNIAGIQMADLCAYPSARYILNPQKPNPAFEIVKMHLYGGESFGFRVYP